MGAVNDLASVLVDKIMNGEERLDERRENLAAEVVFVSISFFQSLSRQKESYHLKVLYKIYL